MPLHTLVPPEHALGPESLPETVDGIPIQYP